MCHMCANSVIAVLYLHEERERETESGGRQRVRERGMKKQSQRKEGIDN